MKKKPNKANKPKVPKLFPTPYMVNKEAFIEELDVLIHKYGFNQIFVAYSEPLDQKKSFWYSNSNVLSEGMVGYLEDTVIHMRDELDRG